MTAGGARCRHRVGPDGWVLVLGLLLFGLFSGTAVQALSGSATASLVDRGVPQKTKNMSTFFETVIPVLCRSDLPRRGARQAIVVVGEGPGSMHADVRFLEKEGDTWREGLAPAAAVIGRTGVAAPGEKREGDGHSPAGVFPIGLAFGYEPAIDSRMAYRQMGADDVWVDDPEAPDYNRLTKKSATKAQSFEIMHRKDDLYKVGLVVEYNTDPIEKGRGSAIFIHIWGGPDRSTAGCIAFPEPKLREILAWLNPACKPVIAIFLATEKNKRRK